MNKVDTTNWAARSVLGALLLFLLAAPIDLMAQEKSLRVQDASECGDALVTFDDGSLACITPSKKGNEALLPEAVPGSITTLFAANNGGAPGGAIYFDVNVLTPGGLTVTALDLNTSFTGVGFDLDVYTVPGSASGNETNPGVWTLVASGSGVGAGLDVPTPVDVSDFFLPPGSTGLALVQASGTADHIYTNGTGGNQFYANADLELDLGSATNVPFTGGVFQPRVWNGTIYYDTIENADLAVTKEIEYNEGSLNGSYHITVYNLGPADANSVIATDYLPAAIIVNSWSTTQGSFDPFSGLWDIGYMADGAEVSLWIYFTLTEQGRYTNEVWVESELDDPDEDNNHAEVSIILLGDRVVPDFVPGQGAGGTISRGDRFTADLTLDKTVDNETPSVGDDVTWTIAVANLGPQSTAKVEVTDTPDGCLAYVSDTPSRGSYDSSTGVWSIGKLKVGEAVSLELTTNVTADCSGEVVNYAAVTQSSLPDPDDQFDIFDQAPDQDEEDSASINVSGRQLELDGTTFALGHNYPNPFNPMTVIPYSVAEVSHVSIKVYDLLGRTVATLVEGTMAAGVHAVSFDASRHPTGMYLVRMEASGIVQTMRITLMK